MRYDIMLLMVLYTLNITLLYAKLTITVLYVLRDGAFVWRERVVLDGSRRKSINHPILAESILRLHCDDAVRVPP